MNRACVALLVFAVTGCGQLLGLGDFSDSSGGSGGVAAGGGSAGIGASAGSAGVGAAAGSAGTAGTGGASGSGGGAGADAGSDAGITYSCTPATGEIEIAQDSPIFANPEPESLRLAGDLSLKHAYLVLRAEGIGKPIVAVAAIDKSGAASGLATHNIPSVSMPSITRTTYPGAMKVNGNKLELFGLTGKGFIGELPFFSRINFNLNSAGDVETSGSNHVTLAASAPCGGPESFFDEIEVAFVGAKAFYAVSCDDSFSKSRTLTSGEIGQSGTFTASGSSGDEDLAAAQLIALAGTRVVQTKAPATYRFGTTSTQLNQAFSLDLASAGSDTTHALGMAPSLDGKGVVILAGRFPISGSAELRTGVVADSKLAELGSKNPSFLTHSAPLMQDESAGRSSYATNGIFTAAAASGGTNIVAHWFGRDGTPRVVNYNVGKTETGKKVTAVGTAVIEETGSDTQSAAIVWLEEQTTKLRVMARVITCSPDT